MERRGLIKLMTLEGIFTEAMSCMIILLLYGMHMTNVPLHNDSMFQLARTGCLIPQVQIVLAPQVASGRCRPTTWSEDQIRCHSVVVSYPFNLFGSLGEIVPRKSSASWYIPKLDKDRNCGVGVRPPNVVGYQLTPELFL